VSHVSVRMIVRVEPKKKKLIQNAAAYNLFLNQTFPPDPSNFSSIPKSP